jgi:leucyl/phenylalanyl-tRNA--protein transferase
MNNPHLDRFGAYIISHREYKNLLNKAWVRNCSLKEFTK